MKSTACRAFVASSALCLISSVALAAPQRAAAPGNAKDAASMPTPRTAEGHPDLTGLWNAGMGGGRGEIDPTNPDYLKTDANGFDPSILATRGGTFTNFERDNTLTRRMGENKPVYRPKYWETIKQMDQNGNTEDPGGNCMPLGVPRVGPPAQIFQTANRLVLLYGNGAASPAGYRVLPIDGREHTNLDDLDGTWNGESIGHWDGDTLVVDSIGFNSSTWLDIEGYIHSENMHVVEKFTRTGNILTWQATVEDPDMLLQPYVMAPRIVRLNPDPKALMAEAPPCSERDHAHSVTKEHH